VTPCNKEAVLLITTAVAGTSTNVARRRVPLKCSLEEGHEGPHRDEPKSESWDQGRQTVIRHEDEKK
jgi:hypothetical protein